MPSIKTDCSRVATPTTNTSFARSSDDGETPIMTANRGDPSTSPKDCVLRDMLVAAATTNVKETLCGPDKKRNLKNSPQKPVVRKGRSPVLVFSDSDDDYYINILDKKKNETAAVKKESHKKWAVASPEVCSPINDSLCYESADEELSFAERLRIHVEERNRTEMARAENELEIIRNKALVQCDVPCSSNVYVNPLVDDIKKELRHIHEIARNLDMSPTVPLSLKPNPLRKAAEVVYLLVHDYENRALPTQTYAWDMDESFEKLRDIIGLKWEVESSCVRIEHAEDAKLICNGHTPRNFGFRPFEYFRITAMILGKKIPRSLYSAKGDLSMIELTCLIECRRHSQKVIVKKNATFADIKPSIMEALRISSISMIVFDAQEVTDDATPTSLDMEDGSMLDVHQ